MNARLILLTVILSCWIPVAHAQEVRDSSGIATVTHTALTPSSARLRTDGRPILIIGVEAGDPAFELYRVTDALLLSNGNIALANAGSYEIRFYDREGRHVGSYGREGSGPGEFRTISWLEEFAAGDSIAAFDFFNQRLTILSRDGSPARTVALAGGNATGTRGVGGSFDGLGLLGDGSLLVAHGEPAYTPRDSTQVTRDSVTYSIWDYESRSPGITLGTFPGDENFVWTDGGSVSVGPLPFGRSTHVAVGDSLIVVGTNELFGFDIFNPMGEMVRRVRAVRAPRELSPEAAEQHRRSRLENLPDAFTRRLRERSVRATPYPDHLAPYDAMVIDDLQRVWLRATPAPGEDAAQWYVFSLTGDLLGSLALTVGALVRDADADHLLVTLTDEIGVERAAVFRLSQAD